MRQHLGSVQEAEDGERGPSRCQEAEDDERGPSRSKEAEDGELSPSRPSSYELCGNISALPRKQFYSSRQTLAMRFHSDPRRGNQTGFRGIYRFVDRGRFRVQTTTSIFFLVIDLHFL